MNQPKYKFGDTLWHVTCRGEIKSMEVTNIDVKGDSYRYNMCWDEDQLFATPDDAKVYMATCRFHAGDVVWVPNYDATPKKATVARVYRDSGKFIVVTEAGLDLPECYVHATKAEAIKALQEDLLAQMESTNKKAASDLAVYREALDRLAALEKEEA